LILDSYAFKLFIDGFSLCGGIAGGR
jgi:hypothetical protein